MDGYSERMSIASGRPLRLDGNHEWMVIRNGVSNEKGFREDGYTEWIASVVSLVTSLATEP